MVHIVFVLWGGWLQGHVLGSVQQFKAHVLDFSYMITKILSQFPVLVSFLGFWRMSLLPLQRSDFTVYKGKYLWDTKL